MTNKPNIEILPTLEDRTVAKISPRLLDDIEEEDIVVKANEFSPSNAPGHLRGTPNFRESIRNMASSLGINSFMSSPTITTNELRELITRDRMMVTEESRQLKEKSDIFQRRAKDLVLEVSELLQTASNDEFSLRDVAFDSNDVEELVTHLRSSIDSLETIMMASLQKFPGENIYVSFDKENSYIDQLTQQIRCSEQYIFSFLAPRTDFLTEDQIKKLIIEAVPNEGRAKEIEATNDIREFATGFIYTLIIPALERKLHTTLGRPKNGIMEFPGLARSLFPEIEQMPINAAVEKLANYVVAWQCSAGHTFRCSIMNMIINAAMYGGLDYACEKCVPNLRNTEYSPKESHSVSLKTGTYKMNFLAIQSTDNVDDDEMDSIWKQIYEVINEEGINHFKALQHLRSVRSLRTSPESYRGFRIPSHFLNTEQTHTAYSSSSRRDPDFEWILGFSKFDLLSEDDQATAKVSDTEESMSRVVSKIQKILDASGIKYEDLSTRKEVIDVQATTRIFDREPYSIKTQDRSIIVTGKLFRGFSEPLERIVGIIQSEELGPVSPDFFRSSYRPVDENDMPSAEDRERMSRGRTARRATILGLRELEQNGVFGSDLNSSDRGEMLMKQSG